MTGCFEGLLFDGIVPICGQRRTGHAQSQDAIYTAWFDLEYDRRLHAADGNYLRFLADPVMPASPAAARRRRSARSHARTRAGICPVRPRTCVYGRTAFEVSGLDATASEIHLLDVTDHHDVVELTGWTAWRRGRALRGDLRFADPGQPGVRWYVAVTMQGVRQLSGGRHATIRDLRSTATARTTS